MPDLLNRQAEVQLLQFAAQDPVPSDAHTSSVGAWPLPPPQTVRKRAGGHQSAAMMPDSWRNTAEPTMACRAQWPAEAAHQIAERRHWRVSTPQSQIQR